jgi:alginate O-acetyltransferase complex protein AlgI
MLFNSHVFLFAYLPVTLLVFFALGRTGWRHAALAWLTVASLFFYGWWDPRNLLLIAGSMIGNFALGRAISAKGTPPGSRRMLLVAGIGANLALLGYFKYANFVVDNWNGVFGTAHALGPIALPLGISFFTFQQISYLVDAYRGATEQHNFVHYCLFVTFFPHLIAGPLVHHGEMLPQFTRESAFRPNRRNLEVGLTLFVIGLFKKVVIADRLAVYAAPVFGAADAGASLSFLEAWCGAIAFTLQLYFDFSAYSDMAIGLARLFGIRLPLNFHSPYKAQNVIEFWRRWHMTLSRFLRDYLYFSLGGNRKGPLRRYANLLVTMLLGGLWHGAGWTFIAWGGLHGLYLAVNHAWQALRTRFGAPGKLAAWEPVLARGVTFLAVVVGWVLFRASTLAAAGSMLRSMAGLERFALPEQYLPFVTRVPGLADRLESLGLRFESLKHFTGEGDLLTLVGMLAVVWFAPNTQQMLQRFKPAYDPFSGRPWAGPVVRFEWRRTNGWALVMSALTVVAVLHLSRISEFLYFQF